MAGVKDDRQAMFRYDLVQGIGDPVSRMDVLHDAVKLEAADPMVLDEIPRLARTHLALARVDRSKRNDNVSVAGGVLGDLIVTDPLGADGAFAVDREQAEGDLLLTVELDDLRDLRPLPRRLEIPGGRIEKLPHHRILRIVTGHLGMDMHIDGANFG